MRLRIGSRKSELARIQAFLVGDALRQAHPQVEINYSFHESFWARNQNDPIWHMPGKGVFTPGLSCRVVARGLRPWSFIRGKTRQSNPIQETDIAATCPRAEARDLLLVRNDRWSKIERTGEVSILTSSPRRIYNLDSFLRKALPAQ